MRRVGDISPTISNSGTKSFWEYQGIKPPRPLKDFVRKLLISSSPFRFPSLLTGELPSEPDKIWTLAKSETDMSLWCNEVLMLNISFEAFGSNCVNYWQGDVIEAMTTIPSYSSATDLYLYIGRSEI